MFSVQITGSVEFVCTDYWTVQITGMFTVCITAFSGSLEFDWTD